MFDLDLFSIELNKYWNSIYSSLEQFFSPGTSKIACVISFLDLGPKKTAFVFLITPSPSRNYFSAKKQIVPTM